MPYTCRDIRTTIIYLIFVFITGIGFTGAAFAQSTDSTSTKTQDSVKTGAIAKLQALAKKMSKESADDFETDKATAVQNRLFSEIKKTMQRAGAYLKNNIDTAGAARQINAIDADFKTASDGVLINKGSAQTFRNLTATSKIITELLNKSTSLKNKFEVYHTDLGLFRYQLDSLADDPQLFKLPKDSASIIKYFQHIKVVARQLKPIDAALRLASYNVQNLVDSISMNNLKLQTALDEISVYQKKMADNSFSRDFDNIWGPAGAYRPFNEILTQARAKGRLTLSFYIQNNVGAFIVLFCMVLASFVYIRSLKNIYIADELLTTDFEGQLVLRYPLLSALIIVISLFQFAFLGPPFILNVIFWAVSCICLSVLFKSFITRYWMNVWLLMVALFLLATLDNLILQASRTERWIMLFLSLIGSFAGIFVLRKGKQEELRERWILVSIGLMVFLESTAVFANVFGRYNLSKSLMISGYLNVVVAIIFLWVIRLINEGLFLAFNVYTHQDKKLFYLNFDKVGKKIHPAFYVLLVIGWGVLIGRSFAGFDYLARPISEFFGRERSIGDYTFTINKLLLFVAIMAISVVISKIVSFFASDNHLRGDKDDQKGQAGIGSWLLLIRITILSIGLFMAIAAVGIPLDKITIVLGALGVGIGFGLQTLVNNLVSGLIIAFEKPVNVGDIVDVDGQGGTMKSIGFRSSVISTWDGADLVMPNGDLLNSHLTNWSLAGNRKRISITIGIGYDANLNAAKKLLAEILENDPRIMKNPGPLIQYEQFGSSSIDVKVYFWARQLKDAGAIRSDLIMSVKEAFTANGITIPIPQQDIYLHKPED
ncbi:Small-conductance mechanosensitive channel [Mucilaginibacter gossypiicola]|uniref:Small-conductance mechanosensitive channel n=1 Tax=Mucilaginibacter gossypiicola TaxID=551995 RepID=A0A1H8QTP2_9SPHI|nr:mechanosensitive ion channel domain-containing protein [Mucilaginibacter gossypiicola]SEO57338.1 Small-conductance mechanosensitive channel [Mucilaginibacter gossypiicola]